MKRIKNKLNLTKFTSIACTCHPKQRSKFRPSLKNWKREKLLGVVREAVKNDNPPYNFIRAEDYATTYRSRVDMVKWCFMKLNTEGILWQPSNRPFDDGGLTRIGWLGSIYRIRNQD